MRKLLGFSLLFLTSLVTGQSYGHFTGKGYVETLSETKQVFSNADCERTRTCDLKKFTLTTSTYQIWFADDPNHPTYASGVIMEYETDSVEGLENYAIVQFKRGCVFNTSKDENGRISRYVSDMVLSFDEHVPFCFDRWVIDSQDTDPAYNSDPERGRFYLLRWNELGSYDERTQRYYGVERPHHPVVYMTDYPSGAFVSGTGVRNTALEFKTCIYKASDVPVQTRRDNISFAHPIACFEWQSVYVYDFATARFTSELPPVPEWEKPYEHVNVRVLGMLVAVLVILAALIALTNSSGAGRKRIAADR